MKRIPIFISSLAIFRTLKIHFRSIQFPSILIIQLPLFAARRSAYFCSVLPQSQALFMLSFSSVAVVQSLGRSVEQARRVAERRVEASRVVALPLPSFAGVASSARVARQLCVCVTVCVSRILRVRVRVCLCGLRICICCYGFGSGCSPLRY